MKYFPLVWAGLWRKPLRTTLIMLVLVVAFTLLGVAQGIDAGLIALRDGGRNDTLYAWQRFNVPMPISYKDQIAQMPGVKSVMSVIGMGGAINGDQKKSIGINFSEDGFFDFFRNFDVTPAQLTELRANRTGILVGKKTAEDLGLKVGERIVIKSMPRKSGGNDWELDILGIIDRTDVPNAGMTAVGNFEYINEERVAGQNTVNFFGIVLDDPDQTVAVAKAIDEKYLNSPAPTRTQVESLAQEQQYQDNNLPQVMHQIVVVTLFVLFLLTFNTLMQAFRERIPEFGTLKALGFTDGQVLGLIVTEAVVQCFIGAGIGLAIAPALMPLLRKELNFQGAQFMTFNASVVAWGALFAAGVALISAVIPAWRAGRMQIVNALNAR